MLNNPWYSNKVRKIEEFYYNNLNICLIKGKYRKEKLIHLKVSKSRKKKYVVLDSPIKGTLGHFYVLKNAPAFGFLENLGQHFFFVRFTDL